MCCDAWEEGPSVGRCPDCGELVNDEGEAVSGCHWSPVDCTTCGSAPCIEAC